jgi:hypothetical protein
MPDDQKTTRVLCWDFSLRAMVLLARAPVYTLSHSPFSTSVQSPYSLGSEGLLSVPV